MERADRLARLVRRASRRRAIATRVGRINAWMIRTARLRRSFLFAAGQPVASLTTTGRRSGLPRTTAVAYFRDGDDFVVSAANLGNERDPDWARNLEANAEAIVVVAGERIEVRARRTTGDEARSLWERWVERQPFARRLARIAGREIPVFRLEPRRD